MKPRAVLFDLDGTLYDPGAVRTEMLTALFVRFLGNPLGTIRTARNIRAFRRTFETLRELGEAEAPLAATRFERAAAARGIRPEEMRVLFEDWMVRRPCQHLGTAMRRDLPACLDRLAEADVRLGVFSDHPVEAKLRAMGVRGRFDQAISAMDPDVNAMKPHPKGLLVACERWGVEPADVVYVGDRADVDVAAAQAAGCRSILIGIPGTSEHPTVLNFTELADRLLGDAD